MKYKSSVGVRRLLNSLIRLINHFLPWGEKIWLIPVIDFYREDKNEEIVYKYLVAIQAQKYIGLEYKHIDDPRYQAATGVVEELERQYGATLEKYLAPYNGINSSDVSQHEDHRIVVAKYRANKNRRT